MLDHFDQALVAVRAGSLSLVASPRELLDEVVVRNQCARHAHGVALARINRRANDGRCLEAARADDRHIHRGLDDARVGQRQAFDLIGGDTGVQPLLAEEFASELVVEQQQVAERIGAARRQLLIGVGQEIDVQVGARRVAWMRERAAGRHMDRVNTRFDQPLAHLRRFFDRVPRTLMPQQEQRVVMLGGADLHLQMEVATDARTNRTHDLEDEARAVFERTAVLVFPVVDRRTQKLRDEVSIGAVELDAVEISLPRAPRALGKSGHNLANVANGHPVYSKP